MFHVKKTTKLRLRQILVCVFAAFPCALSYAGPDFGSLPGKTVDSEKYKVRSGRPGNGSNSRAITDPNYYFNGHPPEAMVELGRNLFFDKVLSGNLNISCASCHHPLTGSGDGLSLPVGEGARGLGITRDTGTGPDAIHERVPRNSPALFNLGARQFMFMFADGRVANDSKQPSGYISPAKEQLPLNLDNVLAVQAMFPVTSPAEMAGQISDGNLQATHAADENFTDLWSHIADKLRAIPEYVTMFKAAFGDIEEAVDISYAHAANAIAAFEAVTWRSDNSPYDHYLRGNHQALSPEQRRGLKLFQNKADCARCHSGPYQTDQQFHAIAAPQIGGGKGDGPSGHEDYGRYRESTNPDDMYAFRTPSLRNVALTAPYSHSGAYSTLEAMIRHHLDAVNALESYDRSQVAMPSRPDLDAIDFQVMDDHTLRTEIAHENELRQIELSDREVKRLLAFLHSLTDPDALDMRHVVPQSVPSGLPVWD
jgi:cytochrome c peroxidase